MKKSLLQILLGVIIGGALFVVVGSLSVLHNSLATRENSVKKVEPSTTDTTPVSSTINNYFATIMGQYSPDGLYETTGTVWLGIRQANPEYMDTATSLVVWRIDKSGPYFTVQEEFNPGPCGSASWEPTAMSDEVVITQDESPCEAGTTRHITVNTKDWQPKFYAKQSTFDGTLTVRTYVAQSLQAEYTATLVVDADCEDFKADNPDQLWEKPPLVNATGISIEQTALDGHKSRKTIAFGKPVPVRCSVGYGGGLGNPGLGGINYMDGKFKSVVAGHNLVVDMRQLRDFPQKFAEYFAIQTIN